MPLCAKIYNRHIHISSIPRQFNYYKSKIIDVKNPSKAYLPTLKNDVSGKKHFFFLPNYVGLYDDMYFYTWYVH